MCELRQEKKKLSLSAADRRRYDSVATPEEAFLEETTGIEPVVWGSVRGDGPTHREDRPRCSSNNTDEPLERIPPEATPLSRRASPRIRSADTVTRSVTTDSPRRTVVSP